MAHKSKKSSINYTVNFIGMFDPKEVFLQSIPFEGVMQSFDL